jgi:class I fructose-bisphosphate aldolase
VEEALRLGADALAVAIGVRGSNEGTYLKILATAVEQAAKWDFPVISHIYPRDFSGEPKIVFDPDNIAWAVRCGIECGADVIKVPYTGDAASYGQIVADCPVPIVAAGGPKAETLMEALVMMSGVVASGARGATIGRNIWEFPRPTAAVRAFKAVIHDGASPDKAMESAGLT